MSRLVAPHVTNRIEIHAKRTYEIQRRMMKSKQRRISNPSTEAFEIHALPKVHQPKVHQPKVHQPKVHQPKVH